MVRSQLGQHHSMFAPRYVARPFNLGFGENMRDMITYVHWQFASCGHDVMVDTLYWMDGDIEKEDRRKRKMIIQTGIRDLKQVKTNETTSNSSREPYFLA